MPDAVFSYPDGLEFASGSELASGNSLWAKIVARYPFNGDNNDAKGSNNGIRYGTGTAFDTTRRALGSAAAVVNGTDDYIDCGNIFPAAQPEITVGGWVYVDNFNQSPGVQEATPIIGSWVWASGSQAGYRLRALHTVGNNSQWQLTICDGTDATNFDADTFTDVQFTSMYAGRWLHILGVFKASSYMRIYIDAVLVAEKTSGIPAQMGSSIANSDWLAKASVGGGYLKGRLDEIAVFDKALSGDEITTLYGEQKSIWADCVARYSFNGDNNDAKGSSDGTRYGTGTAFDETTRRALGSAAAKLNGDDDYIGCGNDVSFDFTTKMFISAWINPSSLSGNQIIVDKRSGWVMDGCPYSLLAVGDGVHFYIYGATLQSAMTAAGVLSLNTRHHIVATYDGANMKIYVDAVEKASTATSIAIPTNSQPVTIGRRSEASADFFSGVIDELALGGRGLSPAEVTALYDEQKPTAVTIPNFESLPLERPKEKFQSSQVLGGGDTVIQDLGLEVQYVKLNITYLSEAKYNELVTFFQTTVNYMGKTFSFIDQLGTVYDNLRLTKPSFSLPRVTNNSDGMYSGQLLLKSEPA